MCSWQQETKFWKNEYLLSPNLLYLMSKLLRDTSYLPDEHQMLRMWWDFLWIMSLSTLTIGSKKRLHFRKSILQVVVPFNKIVHWHFKTSPQIWLSCQKTLSEEITLFLSSDNQIKSKCWKPWLNHDRTGLLRYWKWIILQQNYQQGRTWSMP